VTAIGKQMKAVSLCGNCVSWDGGEKDRAARCSLWEKKMSRSSRCDRQVRCDITEINRLSGSGPRSEHGRRRAETKE